MSMALPPLLIFDGNETGDDLIDHFHIDSERTSDGSTRHATNDHEEVWTRNPRAVGRGGFGTAWLESERRGSQRVVKEVKKVFPGAPARYWIRELSSLALLSKNKHSFPEFYGWFQDCDYVYLAMEYFPLGDLQQCVTSPLDEDEAVLIVHQLAKALDWVHRKKITHRDLKPANILVRRTAPAWWVTISDFGISKRIRSNTTAMHTSFEGDFIAPEVLGFIDDGTDGQYTSSVDLWALGCITCWLLRLDVAVPRHKMLRYCLSSSETESVLANLALGDKPTSFVKLMLRPVPKERGSARDACDHEWLTSVTTIKVAVRDGTSVAQGLADGQASSSRKDNSQSLSSESHRNLPLLSFPQGVTSHEKKTDQHDTAKLQARTSRILNINSSPVAKIEAAIPPDALRRPTLIGWSPDEGVHPYAKTSAVEPACEVKSIQTQLNEDQRPSVSDVIFRSDTPRQKLSDYGETSATSPGQRKHRVSRLPGSNEDQQLQSRPLVQGQFLPTDASDYIGNDIVQVENDGSIPNTRQEQNLALDKSTGKVFDEDTGEVVTVVTTVTEKTTGTLESDPRKRALRYKPPVMPHLGLRDVPIGWELRSDEYGLYYFVDHINFLISTTMPSIDQTTFADRLRALTILKDGLKDPAGRELLPWGWERQINRSGHVTYLNFSDGTRAEVSPQFSRGEMASKLAWITSELRRFESVSDSRAHNDSQELAILASGDQGREIPLKQKPQNSLKEPEREVADRVTGAFHKNRAFQVFGLLVKEGSSTILTRDAATYFRHQGFNHGLSYIRRVVDAADLDRDGALDEDEFGLLSTLCDRLYSSSITLARVPGRTPAGLVPKPIAARLIPESKSYVAALSMMLRIAELAPNLGCQKPNASRMYYLAIFEARGSRYWNRDPGEAVSFHQSARFDIIQVITGGHRKGGEAWAMICVQSDLGDISIRTNLASLCKSLAQAFGGDWECVVRPSLRMLEKVVDEVVDAESKSKFGDTSACYAAVQHAVVIQSWFEGPHRFQVGDQLEVLLRFGDVPYRVWSVKKQNGIAMTAALIPTSHVQLVEAGDVDEPAPNQSSRSVRKTSQGQGRNMQQEGVRRHETVEITTNSEGTQPLQIDPEEERKSFTHNSDLGFEGTVKCKEDKFLSRWRLRYFDLSSDGLDIREDGGRNSRVVLHIPRACLLKCTIYGYDNDDDHFEITYIPAKSLTDMTVSKSRTRLVCTVPSTDEAVRLKENIAWMDMINHVRKL